MVPTTDLPYVRMHGPDVFVYFHNDGNANPVRNARTLQVRRTRSVRQPRRDSGCTGKISSHEPVRA